MIFIYFIFTSFFIFSQDTNKVENGDTVAASSALQRSVALLRLSSGSLCSASFLTPKVLVTAAHCTYKNTAAQSQVRVRDSNGKWYASPIARFITHPQFSLKKVNSSTFVKNDIALVVINTTFPFPVRPLKIGSTGNMSSIPRSVTVAGYGKYSPAGGSGTLRTGEMTGVVDTLNQFEGRQGILMVPNSDQVVCPGDSGGPVINGSSSSTTIIGVHSLSNGCKNSSSASSLSEIIYNYRAWIQQYL